MSVLQDKEKFLTSSLFSVEGKTALVTGGSSGLGLHMAKGLLCNGARVIIASRSQKNCDTALTELSAYGDCLALAADISLSEDRKKLLEFAE